MKQWPFQLFGAITTLILLSGCATTSRDSFRVPLGNSGQISLLSPQDLPRLNGAHMVTINHDGKKEMFIGELHIDRRSIRLDASSLLGPSLFEVSDEDGRLHSRPACAFTEPGLVIAMLELVLARRQALVESLHGLILREQRGSRGKRVRDVYEQGHLILHIVISSKPAAQATIFMTMPQEHLSILMQPLIHQGHP